MEIVTVSPKFQVVIPKHIRTQMGILPGEKVVMFEKDGVIHIIRLGSIKELKGKYKEITTKDLRDEHERFN